MAYVLSCCCTTITKMPCVGIKPCFCCKINGVAILCVRKIGRRNTLTVCVLVLLHSPLLATNVMVCVPRCGKCIVQIGTSRDWYAIYLPLISSGIKALVIYTDRGIVTNNWRCIKIRKG
jgi:hypothetical protein